MGDPDLLVEELRRARRARRVVVILAAITIVVIASIGMAMVLGVLGSAVDARARYPAAVAYVVIGGAATVTIGCVVWLVRARRRAHQAAQLS